MKTIRTALARLAAIVLCATEGHEYRMRCETAEHYPWYRVAGWQCERCGTWG